MKLHFWRAGLCGLAGLALAGAWADEAKPAVAPPPPALIPVEDFARAPQLTAAELSPDGATIAYIVHREDSSGIGFLDLATMKAEVAWARRPHAFRFKNDVFGFEWVSNDRILMYTSFGMAGVSRDISRFRFLSGPGRWDEERAEQRVGISSNPTDFDPYSVIYTGKHDAKQTLVLALPKYAGEESYWPDVFRLNTENGAFGAVLRNPGKVKDWLTDWDGNIRFGLLSDGVTTQLIYRDRPDATWSQPIDFGRDTLHHALAGLDADARTLYVFKPTAAGRKALYAYDLKSGQFSEPLFQHQKYDVETAVFSPKHRRLLGVRYHTEGPRQYWFEPELAKLQKEIDATYPGLVNEIVSMDFEMRKLLIHSHSARDPGYYTLLDLTTRESKPIAPVRPWFRPETMADMFPIKCKARDGLELNGYLTLPVGRGQKNLPLVTFVHGGPYGVRDQWGFDPIVQFLANRGYAVLQVNYRGSGGYGEEFYLKGKGEIGGAIQDDIEDMTRWIVKQGIADPQRLAIMGASYGGYSTLIALARTPDLFRCGVACMAVSNWGSLFKDLEREDHTDGIRWWTTMIGNMKNEKERERMAAVSPVNLAARIKAPLFIMHGKEDYTVPVEQAYAMVSALKKAGQSPETQYFEETGHWWPYDKKGVEFLAKVEKFLATHLGPAAN